MVLPRLAPRPHLAERGAAGVIANISAQRILPITGSASTAFLTVLAGQADAIPWSSSHDPRSMDRAEVASRHQPFGEGVVNPRARSGSSPLKQTARAPLGQVDAAF